MTPHQKLLVQTTFAQLEPVADAAAALFYARLFELDPALRPLFKSDIQEQGSKLMQVIATAVGGLDDLAALELAVHALGRRHAGYGVRDEHYETLGAALLWTLELELGEQFTPDVRDAWATVYWLLADVMMTGAAEPLPRTA
jgi:hemoglobin-like flavoprotein